MFRERNTYGANRENHVMTTSTRPDPSADSGVSLRPYALIFILLAALLSATGYGIYRHEKTAIKEEKYNDLKAIAELKTDQIIAWRRERLSDIRLHSSSRLFREAVARLKSAPDDSAVIADLLSDMRLLRDMYQYENVILVAPDGRIRLSTDPRLTVLEKKTKGLVALAVSSDEAVFGDLFRCPDCGGIHLDVAARIVDAENQPLAVLLLRTDPEHFLFPLIQSWPLPRKSAETLLVRREGEEVLYLNSLRHQSDPPLSHRIPVSIADLPAARAVTGEIGVFEGRDSRGVPVLSDIRHVPDSSWFMVAKMDADEIFAQVRQHAYFIGLLTLLLVALSGAGVALIYKHQGKRTFQTLYRAERERAEAKEEFKTTLYSIGDAVITADVKGNIREMNPVAEALTGWTEAEARGKSAETVFRIIDETTRETVDNPVQKVLEKGLVVGLANHTLLISKDGGEIPIADSGAPIRDEAGDITGVVLVFRDQIKEREIEKLILVRLKLLEYATTHSLEALLRKTLDEVGVLTGSPIGFYHFVESDQKTLSFQNWSTRTLQDFCTAEGKSRHYSIDEAGVWVDCVRARKPVIHNDYKSLPHKKGMPAGHAEVVRELVVPILRADRVVAILGVGNKSVDYTEKDVEIVASIADMAWEITARKQKEEMLWALTSRQEAILSAVPDIIMEVDMNKIYIWANPAGRDFFGEDVVGREAADYFVGDQNVYDVVQPLFDGKEDVIYVESRQRRKDGEKRLLAWWCKVLKDESGKATGALSSAKDITDQRVMEDQLRQTQKMESIGRLAGGVAHDFNNVLSIILGYSEMALEKVSPKDALHEDISEIQTAGRRAADVTRQLLAFARRQTIEPKVLDLNETVESMFKMLRRLIGEDIDLDWHPWPGLWPVKMDPSQIDQILVNLCVNARDAIVDVGKITIETDRKSFDQEYCADHAEAFIGDFVMLVVTDNGCGMDAQTLAQIYEPFFTTKKMGEGTGLGLSTVYGIVKQNNGFINVYSEPEKGTTFRIYLPRHVGDAGGLETQSVVKTPPHGSETMLIVEDEVPVLKLVKTMLERLGYTVLDAATPTQAMEKAREHGGRIHLLITDVVMPEMNGRALAEQLQALYPALKVLFMSGYTANVMAHRGVLDAGVHFIQKPFGKIDLAVKVREAIEN